VIFSTDGYSSHIGVQLPSLEATWSASAGITSGLSRISEMDVSVILIRIPASDHYSSSTLGLSWLEACGEYSLAFRFAIGWSLGR